MELNAGFGGTPAATPPQGPPAQDAPAPADQAAPEQEDTAAPALDSKAIASATDLYKDPAFLSKAAEIYLRNGQPEGLKFLEHAHLMARENGFQAAARLKAGDMEGAVKAWNMSGNHTDAESAVANPDGKTFTVTRKGGQTIQVDPDMEIGSALSPEQYVQNERAKTTAASQASLHDAQAGWYRDRLETTAQVAGIRADATTQAAAIRGNATLEQNRLKGLINSGQIRADQAEAKLDAQYGPQSVYKQFLEKATAGGQTGADAFNFAAKGVIETGAVNAKLNPETGEVYLINARKPDEMWKVLPNMAAYKAITGQDLYVPKGTASVAAPGVKPATVPPAAAPGLATAKAPPAPPGATPAPAATAGVTLPPDFEQAMKTDKARRDAQAAGQDAITSSPPYQKLKTDLVAAVRSGDGKAQATLRQQMRAMLAAPVATAAR